MDQIAQLHARRELYGLLARVLLHPPDAALLDTLRTLPGLAEHAADQEALQVEYEFVFGRNVHPYESLYLDRDLMLNTAATERVTQLYAACDFSAATNEAGAPDHLGLELRLMAHLLAQEIAALERGNNRAAAWARGQQGRCLHEHLARWVPICVRAVERVATGPLYRAVAHLTTELVLSDLERVARPAPDIMVLESNSHALPESHDEEGERGIGRVVRQLITPDEVGMFLSRSDLAKIGRRLGLPAPIGERFQMLRGLFESAGQFEQVDALLDVLNTLLVAETNQIETLAKAFPAWHDGAQHWRTRLNHGRALLDELRLQARAPLDEAAS